VKSRRVLSNYWSWLPLALAIAAASCGGGGESAKAAEPLAVGTEGSPIAVTVARVLEREVPITIQATGSFAADEVSDVAPEVSGRVAQTPVDVGDFVAAGAVIARLSTADPALRLDQARAGRQQAEAALAQARERYNLARANAARYDALVKTGDVSRTLQEQAATEAETTRQGVATAEAALADAGSRVALAEKALADATIHAPFGGYITDRPVAVGEYVTTSSKIATVMKLDPIRLRLQVPELDASRLRLGQTVPAVVEALENRAFVGRITAINPSLDAATRATIVEATIANPNGQIRSGVFATAQVALGDTERGIFVPRDAVLADPNTNSFRVFTIAGDVARLRVVQPGPEQDGLIRVLTGVDPGDQVAVAGFEQLFDGAVVRPVERTSRGE
jgi:RND family efflux transporter MFP subunit